MKTPKGANLISDSSKTSVILRHNIYTPSLLHTLKNEILVPRNINDNNNNTINETTTITSGGQVPGTTSSTGGYATTGIGRLK